MTDRMTKTLLGAIVLLLAGLLVRPWLGPGPAQAQAAVTAVAPASQMVVDGPNIYVLEGGRLRLYNLTSTPSGVKFTLEASQDVNAKP